MLTENQFKPRVNTRTIPDHEIAALSRIILNAAARAFEDAEVMAEYNRWKKQREDKHRREGETSHAK